MRAPAEVVAAILVAAVVLIAHVISARAHTTDDPAAQWYASLFDKRGINCCMPHHDCDTADDWRHSDDPHYAYDALSKGVWVKVPSYAILDRADNPTGKAVICVQYLDGHPVARCFVRPTEG